MERDYSRCPMQPAPGRVCYVIVSGCSKLYPVLPPHRMKKSEDGDCKDFLGNLFQCLTVPAEEKNFPVLSQNLPDSTYVSFSHHTCSFVKNLAPLSRSSPHRHWKVDTTSPQNFVFYRLSKSSSRDTFSPRSPRTP